MKYLVETENGVQELEADSLPLAVREIEKMIVSGRIIDTAVMYEPVRSFKAVRAVEVTDNQGKPVKDRMDPSFAVDGNGVGGVDAISGGLAGGLAGGGF